MGKSGDLLTEMKAPQSLEAGGGPQGKDVVGSRGRERKIEEDMSFVQVG